VSTKLDIDLEKLQWKNVGNYRLDLTIEEVRSRAVSVVTSI